MEVNFDGLRKNGAAAYNRLVQNLNRYVQPDGETFGPGRVMGDTFCTGDIATELDDLRSFFATLICLEGDATDVKALDIDLKVFNAQEGE